MNKTFKRIISLVLAVVIALSCLAVVGFAVTDQDGQVVYDESKRFWKWWVEGFKTFWDFIRYIFYDVFRGRDSGAIPDPPTKQPVPFTTDDHPSPYPAD